MRGVIRGVDYTTIINISRSRKLVSQCNVTIRYRYISLFLKLSVHDIIFMPSWWFLDTGGPPQLDSRLVVIDSQFYVLTCAGRLCSLWMIVRKIFFDRRRWRCLSGCSELKPVATVGTTGNFYFIRAVWKDLHTTSKRPFSFTREFHSDRLTWL